MKYHFTLLAVLFLLPLGLNAQNYVPDSSFGTNGRLLIDFSNNDDNVPDLLQLPSGRLLISASWLWTTNVQGTIKTVRVSENCGRLDTSYANLGKSEIVINGRNDYVNSTTLQPDGKVVAAGADQVIGTGNTLYPMICRIKTNGTLDSSFGSNGRFVQSFNASSNGQFFSVCLYPNGRILAVGMCAGSTLSLSGAGVMRFKPNGTLDSTFGTNGIQQIPMSTLFAAHGTLMPNGDVIIAASDAVSGKGYLRYIKLDSTGVLKSSFGSGGIVSMNNVQVATIESIPLVQTNGKAVIATSSANISGSLFMSRLKADGTADSTFGVNGVSTFPTSGFQGFSVYGASLQPDDKILVFGGTGFWDYVARFKANGTLDSSFAVNGEVKYRTQPGSWNQYFSKAFQTADSTLWAVGYHYYGPNNGDVVLVKFRPAGTTGQWLNLGPDTTLCIGTPLVLDVRHSGLTYLWSTGDTTQTISANVSGTYSVSATDPNGGCSSTDTIKVTFSPVPPTPVITQTGYLLSTSVPNGSLQWYRNGIPINGATADTFTITIGGVYRVAVNVNGCVVFSDSVVSNLGVSASSAVLGLKIFPNPAHQSLYINIHNAGTETSARVIDMSGATRVVQVFNTSNHEIQLADLPAGIYILQVSNQHGVQRSRFVKE